MSKRRFIELLILFYQGMTSERKKEDRSKGTKICSEKKTRLIEQKLLICVSEIPAQGKFWDPKPFSKFCKILLLFPVLGNCYSQCAILIQVVCKINNPLELFTILRG